MQAKESVFQSDRPWVTKTEPVSLLNSCMSVCVCVCERERERERERESVFIKEPFILAEHISAVIRPQYMIVFMFLKEKRGEREKNKRKLGSIHPHRPSKHTGFHIRDTMKDISSTRFVKAL